MTATATTMVGTTTTTTLALTNWERAAIIERLMRRRVKGTIKVQLPYSKDWACVRTWTRRYYPMKSPGSNAGNCVDCDDKWIGAQLLNLDMTSLLIRDLYNHPYNHHRSNQYRQTVCVQWIQLQCTVHLSVFGLSIKGELRAIGNYEFLFCKTHWAKHV